MMPCGCVGSDIYRHLIDGEGFFECSKCGIVCDADECWIWWCSYFDRISMILPGGAIQRIGGISWEPM